MNWSFLRLKICYFVVILCGKALSRDSTKGAAFVNLKADKFSYLNVTSIISDNVDKASECGLACLEIPSCLSYNLAVFPNINHKLLCKLLPSHKYNNSEKFIASPLFLHFSIYRGKASVRVDSKCFMTGAKLGFSL